MSANKINSRNLLLAALFMLLPFLHSVSAQAQRSPASTGGPFGFGIMLGDPNALTAKYHLNNTYAFDAGLAFALDRWFLVYTDYVRHFKGALNTKTSSNGLNAFFAQTTPYMGVGGLLVLSNKSEDEARRERFFSSSSSTRFAIGVRIPFGAEWRALSMPIGAFIELVPGLSIFPSTSSFFQGGFGARFYF